MVTVTTMTNELTAMTDHRWPRPLMAMTTDHDHDHDHDHDRPRRLTTTMMTDHNDRPQRPTTTTDHND